jgi:hypothetical protein
LSSVANAGNGTNWVGGKVGSDEASGDRALPLPSSAEAADRNRLTAVFSTLSVATAFEVEEGVLSGGGHGPSLSSSKGIIPLITNSSNTWNAGTVASNLSGRRDISRDIRDVLTRIKALSVDPSEALATYPHETYLDQGTSRSTESSHARPPPLPEVSMFSDWSDRRHFDPKMPSQRLECSNGLTGEPPELASSTNSSSSEPAVVEEMLTTHPHDFTSSQPQQRGAVDAISSTTRLPHHRQTEIFDNFHIGGPEQSFTVPNQPDTNFSVDGGPLDFHSLMPPFPMQLSHSIPDRSMHNSALEDR